MPRAYEAMRDKFAGQGMDYDDAQTKAAKIYNSRNPGNPVTGNSDDAAGSKPSKSSKRPKRKMPPPWKKGPNGE